MNLALQKNKLIFVHLLNDYSGSPRVLKETIHALKEGEKYSKLYIGSGSIGVLSACEISKVKYWYRRTPFRIFTLFTFIVSQIILFFKLLFDRSISKDAVIFINTLLPFGAALYGKVTKRRVIYHVHEISISPALLRYFLILFAKKISSLNIYVSDNHIKALSISGSPSVRVYNSLDRDFLEAASASSYLHKKQGFFTVLMIASLRDYKGIPELLELATNLIKNKNILFKLVVNDEQRVIDHYFSEKSLPSNLTVYPRVSDTKLFYQQASILLNLSRTDQWIETFGMTILEAMAYGIPVIVPPIGGPIELVKNGVEGFHIDSRDQDTLTEKVLQLYHNKELCISLSGNARQRSAFFSPTQFTKNINSAIYYDKEKIKS